MTAPDKIYLQWADDDDDDYREITWCVDQIEETDVEYCRITAEELAALRHVAEAARAFSVEPTIEQKTIVDEKTFVSLDVSEVRNLAAALAEYDKCRAA